jgi:hypothetical protein
MGRGVIERTEGIRKPVIAYKRKYHIYNQYVIADLSGDYGRDTGGRCWKAGEKGIIQI